MVGSGDRKQVQFQFGQAAEAYAVSEIHASGPSLGRLVELLSPSAEWIALDVATGAGHTAHTLAPYVSTVLASDITERMAEMAARLALEKGLRNVRALRSDARAMPFQSDSFDLVTCRLATHHFPDVAEFMAGCARILRAGGLLAVVDNVVPGSRRRGRAAQRERDAGRYVNAFERLRDPSHVRCLSLLEWEEQFSAAGFRDLSIETISKHIDFDAWTARMRVPEIDILRLRAMLEQAPAEAIRFLAPKYEGARISFRLEVAIVVGIRA